MDNGLFDAYLHSFYRGKSRFARGLDALSLFSGTLFIGFYLLKGALASRVYAGVIALLSAAFVLCVKCAVNAYLLLGHIDKLRSDAEKRIIRRKLLLAPKERLAAMVSSKYANKEVVIIQTAKEVLSDDIYRILRQSGSAGILIASVSRFCETADEARAAIKSANSEFVLLEDEPSVIQAYAVSDDEIDAEVIGGSLLKKEKNKLKGAAPSLRRALSLALVLAAFYALSPHLRYGGYLRALAVFVFSVLMYRGLIMGSSEIKTRFQKSETS